MTQLAIDFAKARDDGIQRAHDHAEEDSPGWSDVALAFLRGHAMKHEHFLTEDVIEAGKTWGLLEPPDRRAWGHVVRKAVREGIIERDGYAPAKTSHFSPKPRWKSRIFK